MRLPGRSGRRVDPGSRHTAARLSQIERGFTCRDPGRSVAPAESRSRCRAATFPAPNAIPPPVDLESPYREAMPHSPLDAVPNRPSDEEQVTSRTRRSGRSRTVPQPQADDDPTPALNAPVTVLPGGWEKLRQSLEPSVNLYLARPVILFSTHLHRLFRIETDKPFALRRSMTLIGTVQNVATRRNPETKREWVEAILNDGTGAVRLVWFSRWMSKHAHHGAQISVSGKIDQHLGRLLMRNPEVEALDQVAAEHQSNCARVPVDRRDNPKMASQCDEPGSITLRSPHA